MIVKVFKISTMEMWTMRNKKELVKFIEQGSLNHFETNDVRALIMPINSEIIYAWMYSFKKNFYGYGIVSFVSYIALIFGSWGIMEHFKIIR